MTTIIAAAVPVRPGTSDRVTTFADELRPVWDEYVELNRQATLQRHTVLLQRHPQGDVAIHIMEVDDPSRVARTFGPSAYDRWWTSYFKDVHGVDLEDAAADPPRPAEIVFDWTR